jgi:hypothetical protein
LMYIIYSKNKVKFKSKFDDYDRKELSDIKKMNRYFWVYIIGSCILFFASITSSAWF